MGDNVSLATFPRTKIDALTMLYLQNQDISKLTPEELFELYIETHDKIKAKSKERAKGWFD